MFKERKQINLANTSFRNYSIDKLDFGELNLGKQDLYLKFQGIGVGRAKDLGVITVYQRSHSQYIRSQNGDKFMGFFIQNTFIHYSWCQKQSLSFPLSTEGRRYKV